MERDKAITAMTVTNRLARPLAFRIRYMEHSDLAIIAQIERESFEVPWTEKILKKLLNDAGMMSLVAVGISADWNGLDELEQDQQDQSELRRHFGSGIIDTNTNGRNRVINQDCNEAGKATRSTDAGKARILGYNIFSSYKFGYRIERFAVREQYRRRKVGSQIAADMIKQLGKKDKTTIRCAVDEANLPCQLFMRDRGFNCVNTVKPGSRAWGGLGLDIQPQPQRDHYVFVLRYVPGEREKFERRAMVGE